MQRWANAWLLRGDRNPTHNLPLRPVLDVPLALLSMLGLTVLLFDSLNKRQFLLRKRWFSLPLLSLFIVSLLPSLLTIEAPHFLRGIGATVIVALVIGAGAATLTKITKYPGLWLIAALILVGAVLNSFQAFDTWLEEDNELLLSYEDRVYDGMQTIAANTPDDMPIYIPGLRFHPVANYLAAGMPERDLVYFDYPDFGATCFVIPREPVTYLDLPIIQPHFEERILSEDVTALYEHPDDDYNIFIVNPDEDLLTEWPDAALAGDFLKFKFVGDVPATTSPGDTLNLRIGMRVQKLLPQRYQIFVHLYGNPTPYEGGTMWATGDVEPCPMLYAAQRHSDETLIQEIEFMLPEDLPDGDYFIAMGLYDPTNPDIRPELQTPSGETRYFSALSLIISD